MMASIRQKSLLATLATLLSATAVVDAQTLRNLKQYPERHSYGTAAIGSGSEGEEQELDNMIIGGSNVMPGDLPFYGHFMGTTMCGGALFHSDIFVTAAHCLENGFPATVKIGATTTVTDNEGQVVSVCAGIIHPNNNMKSMSNDVAILKLCDPVFVNSYATWNADPNVPSATGEDLYIVGFGRTNPTGDLSPFLQRAKVDYLNSDVCATRYNKYKADETMCVDAPYTGICYGDSGGPLLDGNNKVMGFASYIIDTCASDYPDFFTRISTYDSWLREMICSQSISPPMWCSTTSGTGGSGSGSAGSGSAGSGSAGSGNAGQGGDNSNGGTNEDALTQCVNLLLSLFQSLTGNPGGRSYFSDWFDY